MFRDELRRRLQQHRNRVLLRLVPAGRQDETIEWTGADILESATALARKYLQAPLDGVVLLLLPHSPELFLLHLGLVLEGRIPAILAWPTRRVDPEKYQRNLLHQLSRLPADQLITLPRLALNLEKVLSFPTTRCEIEHGAELEETFTVPLTFERQDGTPRFRNEPSSLSDGLFVQFSGGTTGAQKAVMVTASMLTAQTERLRVALDFSESDSVVSWLPMYHDMGLIACLWFPLWHGASSLHFSATDWLLNPESLFRLMDRYRATFCWMPNFAFSYLAAQRQHMKGSYSLGRVKAWINCSEPVRPRSTGDFVDAFSIWGVGSEAVQACYALAENVFAVTQTKLKSPPNTYERKLLAKSEDSHGDRAFDVLDSLYVSSGTPLPGVELRITDAAGTICPEGVAGSIQIRTDSLFSGYWINESANTPPISSDGWFTTGDYGFRHHKDLYVIGRFKDVIIVGGQNVFPEDVEFVVNTIEGVYPGRAIAFGLPDDELGTESLAVVAEMRMAFEPTEARRIERQIRALVLSTAGLSPRYVSVKPARWIVKSTAGKLSRRDTRERFIRENLQVREPALAQ